MRSGMARAKAREIRDCSRFFEKARRSSIANFANVPELSGTTIPNALDSSFNESVYAMGDDEEAGRVLEVHWKCNGSALEVHWKSTGSALECLIMDTTSEKKKDRDQESTDVRLRGGVEKSKRQSVASLVRAAGFLE